MVRSMCRDSTDRSEQSNAHQHAQGGGGGGGGGGEWGLPGVQVSVPNPTEETVQVQVL